MPKHDCFSEVSHSPLLPLWLNLLLEFLKSSLAMWLRSFCCQVFQTYTYFTQADTKCPYSELFWSWFSRNRSKYGEILCISPYYVQMRESEDQNNSEYGHLLRSDKKKFKIPTNIRKYTQNELSLSTNIIYVVVFLFCMFTSKFLTFYYIFSAGLYLALGITKCNSWLICLQKIIINE